MFMQKIRREISFVQKVIHKIDIVKFYVCANEKFAQKKEI